MLLPQVQGRAARGLEQAMTDAHAGGRTAVVVSGDGQAPGVLSVADSVNPTSPETINQVKALGLRPMLTETTEPSPSPTPSPASQVGIDEVITEVLPAGKAAVIVGLKPKAGSSR